MSVARFYEQAPVRSVLDRCRRQIRQHALLRGIANVFACVIGCVLLAALLDYLFALASVPRLILLTLSIAATAIVTWKYLLTPLRSPVTDRELGAAVDLTCPELHESLATLVSVQSQDATVAEAGSRVMQKHLEKEVAGQLHTVSRKHFVDPSRTKKRCGIAAGSLLIAASLALLWPGVAKLLMARLVTPFANMETASNLYFEIDQPDRTVARNSTVEIFAVPKWRTGKDNQRPQNVNLLLTADNGTTDTLPMSYDDSRSGYVAQLERISDSLSYQIECSETTTREYRLTVVDAPAMKSAVLVATPPSYVGRPVEQFDGMLGEMVVFERSQMQIDVVFNKPVTEASLVWIRRDPAPESEVAAINRTFDHITGEEVIDEPENMDPDAPVFRTAELEPMLPIVLSEDGRTASLVMEADVGGEFEIRLRDEHGLSNPDEPFRRLTVVYDKAPELSVKGLNQSEKFRPDDIVPIDVVATDDIGIGQLELHYFVNDQVTRILPATRYDQGAQEVTEAFRLPLDDLGITDGDRVAMKVRVTDERPVPGPHEVWSDEVTIRIDDNAKAPGTRELEKRNEEMIAALRKLQEELAKDRKDTEKIRNESRRSWDRTQKEATQKLSEKQQQQGQLMNAVSKEASQHPLMKQAADRISQLSDRLKTEIPDTYEKAQQQQRGEAGRTLQTAEKQIEAVRKELGQQIEKLQQAAQLEQDLAELNRLALAAENVAQESEQLNQDQASNDVPEGSNPDDWQQQLDQRQQQLQEDQSELSTDLADLLAEQEKLREAAQRAQAEQLAQLAEKAQKLANQQQQLSEAARAEAREAGHEASRIQNALRQAKRDADQLNQEVKRQDKNTKTPATEPLQKAAEELKRGNLNEPQEGIADVAQEFDRLNEELTAAADQRLEAGLSAEEKQQRQKQQQKQQQQANQAGQLSERLENLNKQLNQIQQKRSPAEPSADNPQAGDDTTSEPQAESAAEASPQNSEQPSAEEQAERPSDSSAAQQSAAQQAAASLQRQMNQLVETSRQLQQDIEAKSSRNEPKRDSKDATRRTESGSEKANAGRFREASNDFRQAAESARRTTHSLKNQRNQADPETVAEQAERMESLQQELTDMSQVLNQMSNDNVTQAAAQQQAQQQVAEQASQLPQQLQQMQQTMQLEALQMQQQSERAQQASESANQAKQSTQDAANQLSDQQLQQAQQTGQQAANQLRQVADAARKAQQQLPQPSSNPQDVQVPSQVGESVAEALENLQQAAEAMQNQQASEADNDSSQQDDSNTEQSGQAAGQQGQDGESQQTDGQGQPAQEGQPGGQPSEGQKPGDGQSQNGTPTSPNGQPGQPGQQSGQPSSQNLRDAANALAQAARNALPGQFTPGDPKQPGSDEGMGAWQQWNGLLAPDASDIAGTRNWGQLNDVLDSETGKASSSNFDSEYQSLIRLYFSELAKSRSKSDK